MDRRHFTTGLAVGALSSLSGYNFGHAVSVGGSNPVNVEGNEDEDIRNALRRMDIGPLQTLAADLPRLRGQDISGRSGLSLIETPRILDGSRTQLRGISYVINLDRDLITWDDAAFDQPTPDHPDFAFEGNVRLSGDPAIVIRRVNTSVSVRNGASLMIGGLVHDVPTYGADEQVRTPIIGDLPVIGHLFRRRTPAHSRRNLIIFITARIVMQDG